MIDFSFNSSTTLDKKNNPLPKPIGENSLFFYPLDSAPLIDGFQDNEWSQIPKKYIQEADSGFALTSQAATYDGRLFLRLVVNDNSMLTHDFYRSLLANGDHFGIRLGNEKTYYFRLSEQGSVEAYTLLDDDALIASTEVHAAWQITDSGYSVEIGVEESIADGRMGFFVINGVDNRRANLVHHDGLLANIETQSRRNGIFSIINAGSAPPYQFYQLGLTNILKGFVSSGMRLHVVDHQCNTLATAGALEIATDEAQIGWLIKSIYQRLLIDSVQTEYARNDAFDCHQQF